MAEPVHLTEEQNKDFKEAMVTFYHKHDKSKLEEVLKILDRDGNGLIERE